MRMLCDGSDISRMPCEPAHGEDVRRTDVAVHASRTQRGDRQLRDAGHAGLQQRRALRRAGVWRPVCVEAAISRARTGDRVDVAWNAGRQGEW